MHLRVLYLFKIFNRLKVTKGAFKKQNIFQYKYHQVIFKLKDYCAKKYNLFDFSNYIKELKNSLSKYLNTQSLLGCLSRGYADIFLGRPTEWDLLH